MPASTNATDHHLVELDEHLQRLTPLFPRIAFLRQHLIQGHWDPVIHSGALIQNIKNFAIETSTAVITASMNGMHTVCLKPPSPDGRYTSGIEFTGSHEYEPIAWCQALQSALNYVVKQTQAASA